MQPSEAAVKIEPLAIIKPEEVDSAIVALYFDTEAGSIFIMFEDGVFQFFRYDPGARSWQSSVSSQGEKFVQSRFKDRAAIVLWHYNYDT